MPRLVSRVLQAPDPTAAAKPEPEPVPPAAALAEPSPEDKATADKEKAAREAQKIADAAEEKANGDKGAMDTGIPPPPGAGTDAVKPTAVKPTVSPNI